MKKLKIREINWLAQGDTKVRGRIGTWVFPGPGSLCPLAHAASPSGSVVQVFSSSLPGKPQIMALRKGPFFPFMQIRTCAASLGRNVFISVLGERPFHCPESADLGHTFFSVGLSFFISLSYESPSKMIFT